MWIKGISMLFLRRYPHNAHEQTLCVTLQDALMHPWKSISSRRAAEWRDAALSSQPRSHISPWHDLYFPTLLHSESALIPEQPFEPEETSQEIGPVFFFFAFIYSRSLQKREKGGSRERRFAERSFQQIIALLERGANIFKPRHWLLNSHCDYYLLFTLGKTIACKDSKVCKIRFIKRSRDGRSKRAEYFMEQLYWTVFLPLFWIF